MTWEEFQKYKDLDKCWPCKTCRCPWSSHAYIGGCNNNYYVKVNGMNISVGAQNLFQII